MLGGSLGFLHSCAFSSRWVPFSPAPFKTSVAAPFKTFCVFVSLCWACWFLIFCGKRQWSAVDDSMDTDIDTSCGFKFSSAFLSSFAGYLWLKVSTFRFIAFKNRDGEYCNSYILVAALLFENFEFCSKFWNFVFLKQLGLDARITSWDPKIRIPREKLPL